MTAVFASRQVLAEPPAGGDGGAGVSATAVAPHMPLGRFPARPVAVQWPATGYDRSRVLELMTAGLSGLSGSARIEHNRRRGLRPLLDWLEEQPGQSWQERYLPAAPTPQETAGREARRNGSNTTASARPHGWSC